MKKIASLIVIMLSVGASVFATGTDKGKSRTGSEQVSVSLVPYADNKGITLVAANEAKEEVSVAIYDTAGETVFAETIKTSPAINRSYNLNQLPNGTYTVSVTTDHYTVTKSLDIR